MRLRVGDLDANATTVRPGHPYTNTDPLPHMPDDVADEFGDAELDVGTGRVQVAADGTAQPLECLRYGDDLDVQRRPAR
ncbi:hypothetical protein GCM10010300_15840 [Streptomyces olivaceoviridis]|nr:hypothetical protein GCM10010300_15840 [Streptomyces olivaceoviridis]